MQALEMRPTLHLWKDMIYTSPWPDVVVPPVSLGAFLATGIASCADRPAFIEGASGRVLTHGQVHRQARNLAGALLRRGLVKGNVFAIACPNTPEYAVAFIGVALAGGVATTANPLTPAGDLRRQLLDSEARWLLTTPAQLEIALAAAGRSKVEEVFVLGEGAGATPFAALLQAVDAVRSPSAIDPANDLLCMPYSSGTTGRAKGVMLTHRNMVAMLSQLAPLTPHVNGRIGLGLMPMFHAYGLAMMIATLHRGTTMVTVPRWSLEDFLSLIERYRITSLTLVPPLVQVLAKDPRVADYDLSSVDTIHCGAAPLGAEVQRIASARIARVRQGYGMTEATVGVSGWAQDGSGLVDAAVGYLLPNMEARIVDVASGADVTPGASGELLVRGPNVMRGYINVQAATEAIIDADGWLHTGDLGRFDADGRLYILDRIKELIKVNGFQVAPAELEALLLAHPSVTDAAVVGMPDEEAGERPKAFVVRNGDIDGAALMDYIAERAAPYARLREVEYVNAIPKSPSGKILRRVLRERVRGETGRSS